MGKNNKKNHGKISYRNYSLSFWKIGQTLFIQITFGEKFRTLIYLYCACLFNYLSGLNCKIWTFPNTTVLIIKTWRKSQVYPSASIQFSGNNRNLFYFRNSNSLLPVWTWGGQMSTPIFKIALKIISHRFRVIKV